ncbi:hypothetical protein [Macellibacteroides fermentans]|uniref:hypothetical protein n=1 Tax=Macellibacteroides fermentans TaxID=879969 RepID=UPI00406CA9CB
MKSTVKIFFILLLIGVASSCQKEGDVCYRFEIYNGTEKTMTMNLSSWGNYIMFINGIYNSEYKFHPTEAIESHSSIIFDEIVEDNPDPYAIPSSLTLPWEYIKSIECDGVEIPKEYYSNINNWDFGVVHQINGIFSKFTLIITPELIKQLSQTE